MIFSVTHTIGEQDKLLRGVLDVGPRGRVQQNGTLNMLTERCKLDERPLDEGSRPRQRDKVGYLLHDNILEGNSTEVERPISITHKQFRLICSTNLILD
jgi:hypothetical protein